MQLWALIVDGFRESRDRKIFWVMIGISVLIAAVMACVGYDETDRCAIDRANFGQHLVDHRGQRVGIIGIPGTGDGGAANMPGKRDGGGGGCGRGERDSPGSRGCLGGQQRRLGGWRGCG